MVGEDVAEPPAGALRVGLLPHQAMALAWLVSLPPSPAVHPFTRFATRFSTRLVASFLLYTSLFVLVRGFCFKRPFIYCFLPGKELVMYQQSFSSEKTSGSNRVRVLCVIFVQQSFLLLAMSQDDEKGDVGHKADRGDPGGRPGARQDGLNHCADRYPPPSPCISPPKGLRGLVSGPTRDRHDHFSSPTRDSRDLFHGPTRDL
jgi:hypothetical protein